MTEIPLVNPDTGEVVLRISIDGDVEVVDCRSDVPRVIASGLLLGTAPDMIVPYLWAFDIAAHPDDAMADMRLKFASIQNEGVARGLIDAPKAARYAGDERAAEAMWAYLGMRADLGRNPKVVEVARRLGWKRTTTADRLRRGVELFRSGGDEDREDEIQRLLDEQRSDDASTIARGTSRAGDASERAWVEETDEPGLDHLLDLAWPTEGPEAD